MRQIILTVVLAVICFVAGLGFGVSLGQEWKWTQWGGKVAAIAGNVPWAKGIVQQDKDAPYEMYDYPTIKWRAKPLNDAQGAITQLWTTYEWDDEQHKSGKMNYRLTIYKAPDKQQCEVQLLDKNGFKITQFDASDFHQTAGAPEIMESRESHPCTEAEYQKVRDYSVK
jgi:hypothetical protein